MKLRYIPNILSILRIMLVPFFVYMFFEGELIFALAIYLFAGLTDIVDGYLARRNGWISNSGKILDPIADKLMQCVVLICFAVMMPALWWLAGLFIAKELFMLVGAVLVFRRERITVNSNWYGKLSTMLFYAIVFVIFIMFIFTESPSVTLLIYLFITALFAALFAMTMYIKDTLKEVRK